MESKKGFFRGSLDCSYSMDSGDLYIPSIYPPTQDAGSSPPGWHETFLGSGIPTKKNTSFVTAGVIGGIASRIHGVDFWAWKFASREWIHIPARDHGKSSTQNAIFGGYVIVPWSVRVFFFWFFFSRALVFRETHGFFDFCPGRFIRPVVLSRDGMFGGVGWLAIKWVVSRSNRTCPAGLCT